MRKRLNNAPNFKHKPPQSILRPELHFCALEGVVVIEVVPVDVAVRTKKLAEGVGAVPERGAVVVVDVGGRVRVLVPVLGGEFHPLVDVDGVACVFFYKISNLFQGDCLFSSLKPLK